MVGESMHSDGASSDDPFVKFKQLAAEQKDDLASAKSLIHKLDAPLTHVKATPPPLTTTTPTPFDKLAKVEAESHEQQHALHSAARAMHGDLSKEVEVDKPKVHKKPVAKPHEVHMTHAKSGPVRFAKKTLKPPGAPKRHHTISPALKKALAHLHHVQNKVGKLKKEMKVDAPVHHTKDADRLRSYVKRRVAHWTPRPPQGNAMPMEGHHRKVISKKTLKKKMLHAKEKVLGMKKKKKAVKKAPKKKKVAKKKKKKLPAPKAATKHSGAPWGETEAPPPWAFTHRPPWAKGGAKKKAAPKKKAKKAAKKKKKLLGVADALDEILNDPRVKDSFMDDHPVDDLVDASGTLEKISKMDHKSLATASQLNSEIETLTGEVLPGAVHHDSLAKKFHSVFSHSLKRSFDAVEAIKRKAIKKAIKKARKAKK